MKADARFAGMVRARSRSAGCGLVALVALCGALAGPGCADEGDLAEDEVFRDASGAQALRASRQVTPQLLSFDSAQRVPLSTRVPTALFTFALSAHAHVELTAVAAAGAIGAAPLISVFTVESGTRAARGQSSSRSGNRQALLRANLPAGEYLVSVQNAPHAAKRPLTLAAECTGEGCPAVPSSCLFGDSFSERAMQAGLRVTDEQWLHSAQELADDTERAQVVAALQQSSHTDVRSAEDAFAAADQGELRRVRFATPQGSRYVAWEYGAGDNSYGAYFREGERAVQASIHDGDIIGCSVQR